MSLTVARFVFTNYTLIEFRRRKDNTCIALRIPADTPQGDYPTITFPAPDQDQDQNHKFAILTTDAKQNPWDRGYWRNWKSVMGDSPLQWLLPIWNSPCCHRSEHGDSSQTDNSERDTTPEKTDYPFGHVLDEVKSKYVTI